MKTNSNRHDRKKSRAIANISGESQISHKKSIDTAYSQTNSLQYFSAQLALKPNIEWSGVTKPDILDTPLQRKLATTYFPELRTIKGDPKRLPRIAEEVFKDPNKNLPRYKIGHLTIATIENFLADLDAAEESIEFGSKRFYTRLREYVERHEKRLQEGADKSNKKLDKLFEIRARVQENYKDKTTMFHAVVYMDLVKEIDKRIKAGDENFGEKEYKEHEDKITKRWRKISKGNKKSFDPEEIESQIPSSIRKDEIDAKDSSFKQTHQDLAELRKSVTDVKKGLGEVQAGFAVDKTGARLTGDAGKTMVGMNHFGTWHEKLEDLNKVSGNKFSDAKLVNPQKGEHHIHAEMQIVSEHFRQAISAGKIPSPLALTGNRLPCRFCNQAMHLINEKLPGGPYIKVNVYEKDDNKIANFDNQAELNEKDWEWPFNTPVTASAIMTSWDQVKGETKVSEFHQFIKALVGLNKAHGKSATSSDHGHEETPQETPEPTEEEIARINSCLIDAICDATGVDRADVPYSDIRNRLRGAQQGDLESMLFANETSIRIVLNAINRPNAGIQVNYHQLVNPDNIPIPADLVVAAQNGGNQYTIHHTVNHFYATARNQHKDQTDKDKKQPESKKEEPGSENK